MLNKEPAVCISNDNKGIDILSTIDAISMAGYKNVFLQWYNKDWQISQEKQLAYVKEKGLNVVFAHLGYQRINELWLEGEAGEQETERYINDIKVCADNNIHTVVMHLCSKSEAPGPNEIGLARLKRIVETAEKYDVRIAFENTKIKGYQEYVMDNIQSKSAGICIDVGHIHAHFADEYDFANFKNRVYAVHLHDNDTSKDQHLMPYDGTINWDKFIAGINETNYDGPVTLEIVYRENYGISAVDFYKKGIEIATKLANI